MPTVNNSTYFIKNEAGYSFNNQNFGNYIMLGGKYTSNYGNLEAGLAFKTSLTSVGGFFEGKYTTPKFGKSNLALESRTRMQVDKAYGKDNADSSLAERLAVKGSWDLGKGLSLYEIAGLNAKISMQGDGLKSLTPMSLTGLGYNVNKKLNIYLEGELSKTYDLKNECWDRFSPAVYVGAKYTF